VSSNRFPKARFFIGFGAIVFSLLLSFSQIGRNLENQFFDAYTQWTSDFKKWPDEIVIVLVNEASIQELEHLYGRWPWPRSAHATLVSFLKKAGAKQIAFDITFSEESPDVLHDDRFSAYLKTSTNVWLATEQHAKGSQEPTKPLADAVRPRLAFVNIDKDSDGIIRHYATRDHWNGSERKPLGLGLANSLPQTLQDPMILRWYAQASDFDKTHLISVGPLIKSEHKILEEALKAHSKAKAFDEFDPNQLSKLITSSPKGPSSELFKDKLVLVGCSAAGTFDPVATPLSGHQPGVLVHATALANLLSGDYLRPTPFWMRFLLIFATSGLITWLCSKSYIIRWQVIFSLSCLAGVFAFCFFSFTSNYWFPPAMALVSGALSFIGAITYNYFVESKQKRELKQLFSDFVSPDVLTELQDSPHGLNLNGDSRMGTVLFCDLVGFTTFTETASPEQLMKAINTYLAEASKVMLAHDAYIDKFIGDAVMAIFGIPKVQADHALQACQAALDLQKMMIQLNQDLGREYGISLGLRTGLNSGLMIAGPMGYARKLNYSVLGDTVNLASRLEGANKSYHTRIMIGPLTYELAKNHFETRLLDLLRVKGKHQPVRVYELMEKKDGLTTDQVRLRASYSEGLEHYQRREWKAAIQCFERALVIDSNDGPSQVYIERCKTYQKHSPPSDWDGSFGLDSK
jgi:adenylate cyclase